MRKHKKRFPTMYAVIAAVAIIISSTIGGSLAWLVDSTDEVENTFTVGNINIDLTETDATKVDDKLTKEYKMIPGNVLDKDPSVIVKAGSEACWLFVNVEESTNLDTFIQYEIITGEGGWTAYDEINYPSVYYREVEATTAERTFPIIGYKDTDSVTSSETDDDSLVQNRVLVKGTVEKAEMDGLTADTYPTLTFKAVAVQKDNRTLAQAWDEAKALLGFTN